MFYDVFCGELPSKNAVKTAWSCVDFVLPKLIQCINIIDFELLRKEKRKILRNMGLF